MKPAAVFLLGVSLVLVPVAVRNAAVGGGFYLTTSQFGPNLYLGNNARTDGTAGSLVSGRGSSEYERQDAIDIAERAAGRTLTPGEVSSYWTGQTLAFIRSQPLAWLRLMARKTLLLWNRAEAFDTESQESYAEFWPPLGWLATIGNFGVLVPLAGIGVFVTWRDRQRLAIVYAIVLAYSASVVLFFIYARYRFPLVPFLILFAAAALAQGMEYVRSRSTSQRAVLAAVVVALIIFTNWPLLSATEMRAITEHNLGAALQSEGQIDAAIDRYLRAVTIKPDYVPSYSNLGAALMARGRTTEAIEAYRRALSLDPNFSDAHFNLANALAREGKAHEAVEHYRAALGSAPAATDIHTNLGLALIADRQPEAGRAELETAVRLSPSDSVARYTLGRFLLESGRPAEAVEHLRVAAAAPSAGADVHNDLGIALASLGRADEAIAEFQLALKQQPDYVEAKRNLEIAMANRGRR